MRLRYRNAQTHPDGQGSWWGGNKNGTAPKLKKRGSFNITVKAILCISGIIMGRGRGGGGWGVGE